MNRILEIQFHSKKKRGATMVMLAILFPVLFGLAAFAINVAYIEAVNSDVQITVDAAARAAGREYVNTGSRDAALIAAQEAANLNPVSGQVLSLTADDLEFGVSRRDSVNQKYGFVSVASGGNAVRVSTNSLSEGNGNAIPELFPFFGSTFEIRPLRTATSTQATIDVSLVIDRSGSMAFASDEVTDPYNPPVSAPAGWVYGDPCPPLARWRDLVGAVEVFNQQLILSPQNEQLSLSTYNTTSRTDVQLSYDYSLTIDALDAITANFEGGGTGIGIGLAEGIGAITDTTLSRPYATKVIVLMTDGIHNFGESPTSVASNAAANGITVFTVTFSDEADQTLMQDVASYTGGQHFHAADATQLEDAFREISRKLPSLLTR